MTRPAFNVNNFDLIRLFAASQVVLDHSLTHLLPGFEGSLLARVLACIPGVPVFFFVSGFLVSKSWEASASAGQYARNRILRLYPGLITCVLVSLGLVAALGYPGLATASWRDILPWLVAQLTVLQFYNPDFLRGFGTGALNGSLWTISVELQFYVLVPLVYAALRGLAPRQRELVLVALVVVFMALNRLYIALVPAHGEELALKLLHVSFVPWFYMFLVGVLVQRHLPAVLRVTEGRFVPWLAAYGLAAALVSGPLDGRLGNAVGPVPYLLLVGVVVAAAFSRRELAERLLHRNDVSYGLYIWHMPLINAFLYAGFAGSWVAVGAAAALSALAASASWLLVERPALRMKRRALVGH